MTVGAEEDLLRVPVSSDRAEIAESSFRVRIPHAGRAVVGSGDQTSAIRAESETVDGTDVPPQGLEEEAAPGIAQPDARRALEQGDQVPVR